MKVKMNLELIIEYGDRTKLPIFYPIETIEPWNNIEIHPVLEIEENVFEVTEEWNESFWSIYFHLTNGGLICIADVKTKREAELLGEIIDRSSKTRIHI